MDAAIESLLRCPRTQAPLRRANALELRQLEATMHCEAAYISDAGFAYPIVSGIALLRPDDALTVAFDPLVNSPPNLTEA